MHNDQGLKIKLIVIPSVSFDKFLQQQLNQRTNEICISINDDNYFFHCARVNGSSLNTADIEF